MQKIIWYKYRGRYSAGPGKWEYTWTYEADKKKAQEIIFSEFGSNNYTDGDHFRGLDIVRIKCPPKEYIDNEIKNIKCQIKYLKEQEKLMKQESQKIK